MCKETITVDGSKYQLIKTMAKESSKPIVMIRTNSAGVHYGTLEKKDYTPAGIVVILSNARRVWSWSGAASLSQLSQEGTNQPENCKFPCIVPSIELLAIEIIPISEKALSSLNKVEIWKK